MRIACTSQPDIQELRPKPIRQPATAGAGMTGLIACSQAEAVQVKELLQSWPLTSHCHSASQVHVDIGIYVQKGMATQVLQSCGARTQGLRESW